jgi:hypothetical protein
VAQCDHILGHTLVLGLARSLVPASLLSLVDLCTSADRTVRHLEEYSSADSQHCTGLWAVASERDSHRSKNQCIRSRRWSQLSNVKFPPVEVLIV